MATFLSLKLVWLVLQLIVDTLGINSVNKEMLRISSSGDVSSTLENENTDVPSFLEFITQFQRSYTPYSEEYETREAYFKKHVEVVREHNSKSGHKWRAAVNALADRKPEELAFLRGWSRNVRPHGAAQAGVVTSELTGTRQNITDAPSCVDWTHLDSVQAVLNQGACGSCWAFAAVKAIEAGSEIFQATRRTCSAEQIVSCTRNPRSCGGTGGCSGATSELAFEYVLGTGCQTESDIPYLGVEAVCKTPAYHDKGPYSKAQLLSDGIEMHSLTEGHASSFGMVGWQKLPENELLPVKQALLEKGPLAISVSATASWNFYGSGILGRPDCPKDAILNHAVTLVGFGTSDNIGYWHVLNSWGKNWGENGFVRIERGADRDEANYCGTDDQPQLGTACEGENDPVKVCGTCGILYDTSLPLFSGTASDKKQKARDC